MSRTTWQETFKDSPRYEAIAVVFKLIDKPSALVTETPEEKAAAPARPNLLGPLLIQRLCNRQ